MSTFSNQPHKEGQSLKEPIKVPDELVHEAQELCRGGELLPNGPYELAGRLYDCRKDGRALRVKFGVDPTSSDLHLGHAVGFRKLRQFQDFGHQIVLIIGGFTAQIGDPSGRNSTRPPLTAQQVSIHAKTYLEQMGMIIDMDKAEITNNTDWLAPLNLNEVMRLAGCVTVNQLLAKEAFGGRLDKQLPVGFHELFYPLLQGYDSVAVRCDIEIGGTDQRFNLLQGRELQPHYGLTPQLALLLPLLEGTDGVQKMSKSYNNYIGLKEKPSDMFGKCMRIPDELIIKYFELATILGAKEIDEIKKRLADGENPKHLKELLGQHIVELYHSNRAAKECVQEWNVVHSQRNIPTNIEEHIWQAPLPLSKLLVETKLCSSGAEAKRLINEGAVRVDGQQVQDPSSLFMVTDDSGHVLQVGRRKFVRIKKPNL